MGREVGFLIAQDETFPLFFWEKSSTGNREREHRPLAHFIEIFGAEMVFKNSALWSFSVI